MRIVVYGIGGVGGYFGGKLAAAGFHTTFIARGRHLDAIREKGLEVNSIYGDFRAVPALATDTVSEAGAADLILLCVKSWQLADAAREISSITGPETVVIPLLNGVGNIEALEQVLPKANIMAGLCRIISFIDAPGVIRHKAFHPEVLFGEIDNTVSERALKIKAVFDKAGFDSRIPEDIHLEIWRKFVFIATISGLGALTRAEIGINRSHPGVRQLMEATADEIRRLANAKGVALKEEDITAMFAVIEKQAADTTASMQRDLMEGKPSELEAFNGYVVRESEKLGLDTPVNRFTYWCLSPMEARARK